MILVSHGAFKCNHTGLDCAAAELVLHPDRAAWFIERVKGAGAVDVVSRELTKTEYRERALRRFPQLMKNCRG